MEKHFVDSTKFLGAVEYVGQGGMKEEKGARGFDIGLLGPLLFRQVSQYLFILPFSLSPSLRVSFSKQKRARGQWLRLEGYTDTGP